MKMNHKNIPVFIPNKGCPHTCVFCDQTKISGTRYSQSPQKVKKMLEESLSTLRDTDEAEIAFFGGSFTAIPEQQMVAYLEVAEPFLEDRRIKGIRLSTRPDYISPHIMDVLQKYGVTTIELGVQSLDPGVLLASRRGHTVEDTYNACRLIKDRGVDLGIQTMLGLPGDTFEKSLGTAYGVLRLCPDMVRIYPTLVIEGTELEALYKSGSYRPLTMEEAVEWCTEIVPLYLDAGITLLRIGLHSSETLEGSILAGPYHPAFGELVESGILYKKLEKQLDSLKLSESDKVIIKVRPDLVSKMVGQKRSNINAIRKKYGPLRVKVIADEDQKSFSAEKAEL